MKKKIYSIFEKIYWKVPAIQPFMKYFHQKIFNIAPPKFSGWGMTSRHELPWIDKYDWDNFRQSAQDIKKQFEFVAVADTGTNADNIDTLLWRHWIVSFSVRYAVKFNGSKSNELNSVLVELGVGDGVSAFFALREMENHKKNTPNIKYTMHLYDSWGSMREKELLKTELSCVGKYSDLSLEKTKRNLTEFEDNVFYHQGYIPESLKTLPAPDSIIYLHIDLNSAIPTLAGLEFFYPRIVKGGVILFDDYGWLGYGETKEVVDKFFAGKTGILMKLPTGQAVFFV